MLGYNDLVELVKRVQATGGLDVDNESICNYQDMIGHSADEELTELSNGAYKQAFYRVYGHAYGTIEAIRFYCTHGEKIQDILRQNDELHADIEDLTDTIKKKDEKLNEKQKEIGRLTADYQTALFNAKGAEERAAKAEAENIALKAKLYDLMTA